MSKRVWEYLVKYNSSLDFVYALRFPRKKGSILDLNVHARDGVYLYTEPNSKVVCWVRMDKGLKYNDIVAAMKHFELDVAYDTIKIMRIEDVKKYKINQEKFNYVFISEKHTGIAFDIYEDSAMERY